MNTKQKIKEFFKKYSKLRPDLIKVEKYLDQNGFYECPASKRFHGSYKGGLADHSWNLYEKFSHEIFALNTSWSIPIESCFIVSMLHDVCKIGAYLGLENPFTSNPIQPQGHALLSLERIKRFIELTPIEEKIIKYHMGVYGTFEFSTKLGEYSVHELTLEGNNEPLIKLFHWCDDYVSQFVDTIEVNK